MGYGKVTEDVLSGLRGIVGDENILTDKENLEKYATDETPLGLKVLPEVVVKPESTEHVSRILALANEKRIPVTPRGQGTGLCNGAVPVHGGILLSLEKMNRILEIDEDNLMAVVEAGVVLSDLRAEVEKRGLFYPADPGERTSMIGGNVNTNAGGMNGVKYGNTRNYVLGLEAVLPNGRVLHFGGKIVKKSSGYDLMQLIIGSEGTLAVVTKVIIRLIKLPKLFMTLYIPFNNLFDAAKSVSEILRERMTPTAMEFVERDVIIEAEKHTGKKMPHHDAEAYLIIRIDGDKEDNLYEDAEGISEICLRNNAVDVLVADTKERQDRIWDMRSIFYEVIVKSRIADIVDAAIPPSKMPEYVKKIRAISKEYGVRILSYGHAGDGNIHVHPIKDGLSDEEWDEKLPKVMERLYREAVDFGGIVSGEHGIGWTKKKYLPICLEEEQIRLMREIKRIFDPNNILNPGKIFDIP
ncbi:MAG: FAD-binding oxidoreductase, partial [Candidatus Bathyarchaeia archaeon]